MSDIIIETNGQRYTGWKRATVSRSIENLCATFSFNTTASLGTEFPVKLGEECKIFVDGILFLTGWVEKINVRLSSDAHHISVHGRDRTNDLVDSQLGENIEFQTDTTLKKIVEKVLKELNLSKIQVIDRFNLKMPSDIETDSMGVTGFEFIERFAKKKQVLLTTNGDGDIVFERSNTDKYNTILSTEKLVAATILESHVVYDDTKRFNEYNCIGQTNNGAQAFLTDSALAKANLNTNIEGKVKDKDIRTSRKYFFQPEDNGDDTTNLERAKWEANYRRSQSMVYNCTVQGFKPIDDDGIWEINKQLQIIDEFTNINSINSTLLVTSVTFSQNVDGGSKTLLTCKTNDAYKAIVNKPQKDSQDQNQGAFLINRQGTSS